jgi:hypothetical protein
VDHEVLGGWVCFYDFKHRDEVAFEVLRATLRTLLGVASEWVCFCTFSSRIFAIDIDVVREATEIQEQNPELMTLSGPSQFVLAAMARTAPAHLPQSYGWS